MWTRVREKLTSMLHDGHEALIYSSVNQSVLERVPASARTILDVGCGDGTLGRSLRERPGCVVTGLTDSDAEAHEAERALDRVVRLNLDTADLTGLGRFDTIICSHVLEHLRHPGRALTQLRADLLPAGTLIVALPNPLLWRQRVQFLVGRFRYTKGGIMDDTHLRFFDWETAAQLVEASGYRVVERFAEGGFPGARLFPRLIKDRLDQGATRRWPGLFGTQFVLVAKPDQASAA